MLRGCLALIVLLHVGVVTRALPTIQGGNVRQQLDKSFFQPPEIEQTIDEVQKILANDPALPRLTRGEIEELYEKVTREEYEKSLEAGDMSRADSMRALMLVLPFNTDNNTEENLQELYTRPPVTRVIDAYTPPDPVKFLTPDPSALPRSTVPGGNPAVAATTYKPAYSLAVGNPLQQQFRPMPQATTYHPPAPPPVVYQDFKPVTAAAASPPAHPAPPAARFSSHYSAKNAQFLRKPKPSGGLGPSSASSTVKPVADILESLGIVSGGKSDSAHKRYAMDDYYPAESAPQPSVVAVADLRGLQGARIRPEAYSNFKPLNIGEELRVKPEVEGYLTRFGIVKKAPKALKKEAGAKPTEEPAGAHTELSTATARLPSQGNAELAKLLKNLQELERLQSQPQAKRSSTTSTTSTTTSTSTTTTTTPAPVPLITHGEPLLIEAKKPRRRIDPNIDLNFANGGNHQTTPTSSDELSKLLQNLQELEKLKINPENVIKAANPSVQSLSSRFTTTSSSTSTTTSTTTPPPALSRSQNEARELQRILKQLQQLEQSSRTTTTSTTTVKPARNQGLGLGFGLGQGNSLGAADLLQLQRLLSDDRELEKLYEQARNGKKKQQPKTTTSSTSTSTSTTSTSTTTTTPRPTPSVDHAQFEALITRVQQLEQLQQPTTPPNFLTRNVAGYRAGLGQGLSLPSNDFAHLQELSPTSASLLPGGGQVEISTAASTSKQRPLSHFERSNGLLQQDEVHPQDYVQLQKLLSKVQELERVQLRTDQVTQSQSQLVTAASVRSPNVKTINGAHIVYAQPAREQELEPEPELKLDLPVYQKPQKPPTPTQSSSEELRELAMSQPAHPQRGSSPDFGQLQQFFGGLEDTGERQSYQHMQPIYKTAQTTPSAPRFVPARRAPTTPSSASRKPDLEELQKLLYNTQQLQKLGVALPHELSLQLESQLQATSSSTSSTTTTTTTSTTSTTTTTPAPAHDTSSPAVFSLTTSRPRIRPIAEPKPTTESSLQLPVFSATKIIEAAIKRAANRIGVSTELAPKQGLPMGVVKGLGFRRRSDGGEDLAGDEDEEREGELDGDLMAEFSEFNYQLAKPEPETPKEKRDDSKASLSELQRLISNLQELQQLNVSLDQVTPTAASSVSRLNPDAAYLQSLQNGQDETLKARRQSDGNATTEDGGQEKVEEPATTTQAPTKISLSLGLDDTDGDTKGAAEEDEGTSSTSTSTTTTTTEESRNGSLDDLADSFGPDPVSEEPPPPKKKNGFYFLADWNSFLEVGDGDDQVVVRLSPKIGDPRLFLPVKIPS
ncbi:uncharacterized protein LOC108023708 [Drosophila biarmipes]|uniref:uncharacterized protein LOC108023708 n=1 Tax=Drosophila biarmipes TaxID=125945 RepID=UPI0007E854DC|nr:uncharacterized protein LOC108023708 [Drosophila biarmipes]